MSDHNYRVMRLNRNPDARGYIVRVLEYVRTDDVGNLVFRTIATSVHGTKAAADRAYDKLRDEYGAMRPAA
jgi:hypothetical protein